MFYLYSPEGATYLALPMPHWLKITNFFHPPLSFNALAWGDSFQIYGEALRIMKLQGAAEKSGSLNFFAVFSATVWDFNMKFFSFI